MAPDDGRQRLLLRLADGALVAAAALALVEGALAARAGRGAAFAAAPMLLAAALVAARLRLAPRPRLRLAAGVAAAALFFGAVEGRLAKGVPHHADVAAAAGRRFDARTVWEIAEDERAAGKKAIAAFAPRAVLARRGGGVEIDGAVVLPLGGVSGETTLFCNEAGAWASYEADERGFNNPRGIWGGARGALEVAVLGEGFMQGGCVPGGQGAVDVIRGAFLRTLNLAMNGNGPLLELAALVEYLSDQRPRFVVWAYYDRDLAALEDEKRNPILGRYLEGGFRQGLAQRQAAVDAAVRGALAEMDRQGARFPAALAGLGATRARSPHWLQDLVTGSDNSAAGAGLRFDRVSDFLGARLSRQRPPPPDLATFKRVLGRAQAAVNGWGGTLFFAYLPDVHQLRGPEHPWRAPVLALVRELGLPLVDVHPAFTQEADPGALRWHESAHCNEKGHALLGRTLLGALARAAGR
jgi:hypothetical protein